MKYKPAPLKPVERIPNRGFLRHHCCKCGAIHVFHFQVDRGKTEDEDLVIISHFRDFAVEKLEKENKEEQ